jgi:hypothetical protein
MKFSRVIVTGSIVVAGASFFGALHLRRGSREVAGPAEDSAAAVSTQRGRRPPLFTSASERQQALDRFMAPGPSAPAAPQAPPAEAPGEPAAPTRPAEPADVRRHFEEVFASESAGAGEANTARNSAETRLRNLLPRGSSLNSVRCGVSMCRIDSDHETIAAYNEFVEKALIDPATQLWNAAFVSVPSPDAANGRVAFVAFIARPGASLPRAW